MANQQHLDWLFEGVGAWNSRREADDFTPDFEGVNLSLELKNAALRTPEIDIACNGANFEAANLRDVNLEGVNLQRAILKGADLTLANLRNSHLNYAVLVEATLVEADMANADLARTTCAQANLSGANLTKANLRNASLVEADLSQANLRGAGLYGADFSSASFTGADLKAADLSRAQLRRADLIWADLRGAVFQSSRLKGANFVNADVRSIRRGKLTEVGLTVEAELTEVGGPVPLVCVNLAETFNLTQEQLISMKGDSGTILPEQMTRPEHWQVLPLEVWHEPPLEAERGDKSSSVDIDSPGVSLSRQIEAVLADPIRYAETGQLFEDQINYALRTFRAANQINEIPDDLILVEQFGSKIGEIRQSLLQAGPINRSDLEREVRELRGLVDRLCAKIRTQAAEIKMLKQDGGKETDFQKFKSAFATSAGTKLGEKVVSLGTGTVGIIIGAAGTFIGLYGAASIQDLTNAFADLFGSVPPDPPPDPPPTEEA